MGTGVYSNLPTSHFVFKWANYPSHKENLFNFLKNNNAVKDENYGFINHSGSYLPLVRLNSYAFSYDENDKSQLFGDSVGKRWGFNDFKWYVKTEKVNNDPRDGLKAVESF